MLEIDKWKLVPTPCYKAKCRKCGYESSATGTREQTIAWFKVRGWQLRGNGPWCPECVRDDEMGSHNSEVRPK